MRIRYARASTVRQSLDTQADSLQASGVTRIFAEKISTRAVTRPELDKAVALAREIRASGAAVTIVVHEHKRLGRGTSSPRSPSSWDRTIQDLLQEFSREPRRARSGLVLFRRHRP